MRSSTEGVTLTHAYLPTRPAKELRTSQNTNMQKLKRNPHSSTHNQLSLVLQPSRSIFHQTPKMHWTESGDSL